MIPRIWKDSQGNKAVVVLFSEMAPWKQFSNANSLWHQQEDAKGRRWISRKKRKGLMALLNIGIAKLTERQKECFYLYYFRDKTEKDIGKILGISQQMVSYVKNKAIRKLRKILGADSL